MTTRTSQGQWILLMATGSSAAAASAALFWWRCRAGSDDARDVIQRQFWDRFYDRCAPLYDCVDWFTLGYAHRLRKRALPHLAHDDEAERCSVLEIGFGTGRLHVELAKMRFATLAGLDMAPGMVRLTRRRLASRGAASDLRVGDATRGLPWGDGSFDAVLSTFCLSAISDASAALDEMVRVLRPGGRIVVVDAGRARDGNRMASFLACVWEVLGDFMRDDASMLAAREDIDNVTREDYGPWGCVHVTVGEKKAKQR